MSAALEIWCVTPSSSGGWGPITALARLAGRLLEAPVRFVHPEREYSNLRKAVSLLPGRRAGHRALLLIAAQPGDLLALADARVLVGRYRTIGAWIIDSFWAERLPRFMRSGRHGIDQLWITDKELLGHYRDTTGTRCEWLPWGTDVLAAVRSAHPPRSVDVLRLGRQPALWDDDAANASALAEHGLTYQGRFELADDGEDNQAAVRHQLDRAKVVLASGSLASRSDYSHPTRDYISARFTDAVASGTRIAGSRPQCAAADLIPDEAWIDLELVDRGSDAARIADAVAQHDEARADRLRRAALIGLDWRHRLHAVARRLDTDTGLLQRELDEVRTLAASLSQDGVR